LFYVMPYVEGESLRHRLDRERQLPVDEAVRIAAAVANALDYAHASGVIHRDLKPENILLQHGQAVVADFGIALAISNAGGARLTQTGISLGTPQYMSPEQATGDRIVDRRADIYSLGAVLYEMLTGEPPHAGQTAQAVFARLMTEDVRSVTVLRRSVPPHVDAAVRRALEKLPSDRFATGTQFADALVAPNVPVMTAGAAVVTSDSGWSRVLRRALPWTITAVAVAVASWSLVPRPSKKPGVSRFTISVKAPLTFDALRSALAVSPDGSRIVFSALRDGQMQVF